MIPIGFGSGHLPVSSEFRSFFNSTVTDDFAKATSFPTLYNGLNSTKFLNKISDFLIYGRIKVWNFYTCFLFDFASY